ncbi:hypothetical protein EG329_014105 [Mollisiaceae sp. DMI_Dod_QoI]|nr:hypothetical protein EG329_014105 [Helotiales sp. DMI_Dod_QoI]
MSRLGRCNWCKDQGCNVCRRSSSTRPPGSSMGSNRQSGSSGGSLIGSHRPSHGTGKPDMLKQALQREAERQSQKVCSSRYDLSSSGPSSLVITKKPDILKQLLQREAEKQSQKGKSSHYDLSTERPSFSLRPSSNQVSQRPNTNTNSSSSRPCLPPSSYKLASKLDTPKSSPTTSSSSSTPKSTRPSTHPTQKSTFKSPHDLTMASRQTSISTLPPAERLRQEKWAQTQLRQNASSACPVGLIWLRDAPHGGYRCLGGSHFVPDALLAEGKGGYYEVGIDRRTGEDVFPGDGPFYGPDPVWERMGEGERRMVRMLLFGTESPTEEDATWR